MSVEKNTTELGAIVPKLYNKFQYFNPNNKYFNGYDYIEVSNYATQLVAILPLPTVGKKIFHTFFTHALERQYYYSLRDNSGNNNTEYSAANHYRKKNEAKKSITRDKLSVFARSEENGSESLLEYFSNIIDCAEMFATRLYRGPKFAQTDIKPLDDVLENLYKQFYLLPKDIQIQLNGEELNT